METTKLVYGLLALLAVAASAAYLEHGRASFLQGQLATIGSFVPDGTEGTPYTKVKK